MTSPTYSANLDAATLQHPGALAGDKRPRFRDPQRATEEVADLFEQGTRPTVGSHRRHREPRPVAALIPRPARPEVVTAVVREMVADGWPVDLVAEVVVEAGTAAGLDEETIVQAGALGIRQGRYYREHRHVA